MLTAFLVSIGSAAPVELYVEGVHADTLVAVEFQCNMSVQILKGNFDPAADTLFVSGSFNDWGNSRDIMTDPDLDSLYTVDLKADSVGETIEFKYQFYDVSASASVWEGDPNRSYLIPDYPSVYYAWFKNDSVFVQQYDITFTFICNMELERLSGRFDPATDTVSANGDFNGWTPRTTILEPRPLEPDVYEGTAVVRRGVGETIEFKYWYTENNWESVSNRLYTFTAEDIGNLTAEFSAPFNDGTLDNVINQPCDIKFTVYTTGAVSIINTLTFPVINTVHIAGSALPLQWPQTGWPNGDSTRMIKLYDDGTNGDAVVGDYIFTNILTLPAYTPLEILYKYGINWGDAVNNGGGNDNEAGFATNHTLQMTKYMSGATTVDTFGVMRISTLTDILGVKEIAEVPRQYNLKQNYPNPFNPTTMIEYGIPEESFVTLTVYNVLGQVVTTLVNQQQHAGTYGVTFDASLYPSGIYFYKITAGDYVNTYKMVLMK